MDTDTVALWDRTKTVVHIHAATCPMVNYAALSRPVARTIVLTEDDVEDMKARGYEIKRCRCCR